LIPALIRRFHDAVQAGAESVTVWGTGQPMREFLHVDDMAAACVHVMDLPPEVYGEITEPMLSHLNVGTGLDCTIRDLVEQVAEVVGFNGRVVWDDSMPDGTPRKLLSVERLRSTGWRATTDLATGLADTYRWYRENIEGARH